jgi:predicted transcriptional regulator
MKQSTLTKKDLINTIKARKRKDYEYLFTKSIKLLFICFDKLEEHKEFKLVSSIADFYDCSSTEQCDDDLIKDK